jgi:xanthine dehydrogenase iron-sulfur cluster and FAD-binding subunit A
VVAGSPRTRLRARPAHRLDGSVVARRKAATRDPGRQALPRPLSHLAQSGELAISAHFQLPPEGAGWGFAEVARRHGDFALVGCAAVLALDAAGAVSHARLGFFGVGGTAVRSAQGEAALMGREPTPTSIVEAAKAAAAALSPDGDCASAGSGRRSPPAESVLAAAVGRCGRAHEAEVRVKVNGTDFERAVDVRSTLQTLSEDLGLTGTHVGCEHQRLVPVPCFDGARALHRMLAAQAAITR